MPRTTLVLIAGLVLPAVCGAQADSGRPVEIGRSFRIQSRSLGEQRVIDVALPAGYAADTGRRYPVLVVLDGDFEFEIAAATARFYAATNRLPDLIVVGVHNPDRTHDLTPAPVDGFAVPLEARNPGGASRFLEFIGDELVPYLDRAYRTAPMRVLVGHSLGGLFAFYSLATRPQLFTGYLVMEPSVWWNNHHEHAAARTILGQPAGRHARVVLVNGEPLGLDTTGWGGTRPMVRDLAVPHTGGGGETHASMALAGMMQGLRILFADFQPMEWRPGMRPIAMLERYDSLTDRVGYAVPIPEQAYAVIARMSLDSRFFDDAARVLERMERALGPSDDSRQLRERLVRERDVPAPAEFVQLEIPDRRPTPREAAAFLGRWTAVGQADGHEVRVRASGDTIVVWDRIQLPNGDWFESDDPVIQVTSDGTLEWGLPWFRGIAALLVLRGRLLPDSSMEVTRQVRGWVPRGRGPDLTRTERLRRAP